MKNDVAPIAKYIKKLANELNRKRLEHCTKMDVELQCLEQLYEALTTEVLLPKLSEHVESITELIVPG